MIECDSEEKEQRMKEIASCQNMRIFEGLNEEWRDNKERKWKKGERERESARRRCVCVCDAELEMR